MIIESSRAAPVDPPVLHMIGIEKNPVIVEQPPAYSFSDSMGEMGSIRSRRDQDLPPAPSSSHHSAHHPRHPRHRRDKTHDHILPSPSVDQVHIFDKRNEIKGTFYIDPTVPLLDSHRIKHHHRKGKGGKSKQYQPPHASFRGRQNPITLDLGTTGDAEKAPKANIVVSNHSRDIRINLLPTPASRPSVGLEVSSSGGNAILFVPEEFSGVVTMSTRRGTMQVLPALQARIKIVKNSEHEIIFMVGAQDPDTSREASYCQLETRTGNIIVGLVGRDTYAVQPGFWQRLFRGNSSSSTTAS